MHALRFGYRIEVHGVPSVPLAAFFKVEEVRRTRKGEPKEYLVYYPRTIWLPARDVLLLPKRQGRDPRAEALADMLLFDGPNEGTRDRALRAYEALFGETWRDE